MKKNKLLHVATLALLSSVSLNSYGADGSDGSLGSDCDPDWARHLESSSELNGLLNSDLTVSQNQDEPLFFELSKSSSIDLAGREERLLDRLSVIGEDYIEGETLFSGNLLKDQEHLNLLQYDPLAHFDLLHSDGPPSFVSQNKVPKFKISEDLPRRLKLATSLGLNVKPDASVELNVKPDASLGPKAKGGVTTQKNSVNGSAASNQRKLIFKNEKILRLAQQEKKFVQEFEQDLSGIRSLAKEVESKKQTFKTLDNNEMLEKGLQLTNKLLENLKNLPKLAYDALAQRNIRSELTQYESLIIINPRRGILPGEDQIFDLDRALDRPSYLLKNKQTLHKKKLEKPLAKVPVAPDQDAPFVSEVNSFERRDLQEDPSKQVGPRQVVKELLAAQHRIPTQTDDVVQKNEVVVKPLAQSKKLQPLQVVSKIAEIEIGSKPKAIVDSFNQTEAVAEVQPVVSNEIQIQTDAVVEPVAQSVVQPVAQSVFSNEMQTQTDAVAEVQLEKVQPLQVVKEPLAVQHTIQTQTEAETQNNEVAVKPLAQSVFSNEIQTQTDDVVQKNEVVVQAVAQSVFSNEMQTQTDAVAQKNEVGVQAVAQSVFSNEMQTQTEAETQNNEVVVQAVAQSVFSNEMQTQTDAVVQKNEVGVQAVAQSVFSNEMQTQTDAVVQSVAQPVAQSVVSIDVKPKPKARVNSFNQTDAVAEVQPVVSNEIQTQTDDVVQSVAQPVAQSVVSNEIQTQTAAHNTIATKTQNNAVKVQPKKTVDVNTHTINLPQEHVGVQEVVAILTASVASVLAVNAQAVGAASIRGWGATPGVASGDGDVETKVGIWAKGLSNSGSAKKDAFKYLDLSYNNLGATIGLDATFNDRFVVGGALTIASGKISSASKQAEDNTANKDEEKINTATNIFSLYGRAMLMNELSFDANVNFGQSKLSDSQNSDQESKIESSKDLGKMGLFDIAGKFVYSVKAGENAWLRPFVGAGYTSVTAKELLGQKIEGNNKDLYNHARIMVGTSVGTDIVNGDLTITPEVHVGGALVLGSSSSKDKEAKSVQELVKTELDLGSFFNVGASANVGNKNGLEFGVGGDINMNKKFNNYSGFLKVKVSL